MYIDCFHLEMKNLVISFSQKCAYYTISSSSVLEGFLRKFTKTTFGFRRKYQMHLRLLRRNHRRR